MIYENRTSAQGLQKVVHIERVKDIKENKSEVHKVLKPLQNMKGQNNLGYPRKKQSFSL